MVSADQAVGLAWLAYVAIDWALLGLVLWTNVAHRANRTLALLLTLDSGWILCVACGLLFPEQAGYWSNLQRYFELAWPLAAINFVLVYPHPRLASGALRLTRIALLLAGTILCFAFAVNHALYVPNDWSTPLAHYAALTTDILPILLTAVLVRDVVLQGSRASAAPLLLGFGMSAWMIVRFQDLVLGFRSPYIATFYVLYVLLIGYVGYHALRHMHGSTRHQLRRFTLASLTLAGISLTMGALGNGAPAEQTRMIFDLVVNLILPILFSYAVLKYQLLGVDLKVRWSISHGTVAAAFVAAALVGTQLAENFLNTQYNWVVGSLTAGLLAFAVKPLQSLAERVADSALPSTKRGRGMSDPERIAAYQRNLEIAWSDGKIGKKERQLLRNLRDYLGVSAEEAEAAELRVTRLN